MSNSPQPVLYLRLSEQLKQQLRLAAKENGRTMTAEAIIRLKQSLEGYWR